jgi:hypothetical protein
MDPSSGSHRGCTTRPLSTTWRRRGKVIEVSAMVVATITLGEGSAALALSWPSSASSRYRGRTG